LLSILVDVFTPGCYDVVDADRRSVISSYFTKCDVEREQREAKRRDVGIV